MEEHNGRRQVQVLHAEGQLREQILLCALAVREAKQDTTFVAIALNGR